MALFVYPQIMAYDDNAKRLAIKAIGTVESRLDYNAINYGDPITVGIMQWYGVRAAALLRRTIDENIGSWSGASDAADTIAADLMDVATDNPWWNSRRLTQAEGESLRPVLGKNRTIQDDQAIKDLDVYKQVAINNGMDPDGNTKAVIFFFSMYHQGPVYAFQVLSSVGAGASLEQLRNGALANPVLGQYSNRYNEVYEILTSENADNTDPVNPGNPTVPTEPVANFVLQYIEVQGNNIALHLENETLICYPATAGRWMPSRELTPPTPPITPAPDPDPETPPPAGDGDHSGSWTHPLPGATLTSGYGPRSLGDFHAGVDLSTTTAARGANILAPCDLEITQAMNDGDGGFNQAGGFVKGITTSGEKYTMTFFHMAPGSVAVKKGQKVSRGAILGVEGQTGKNDNGTPTALGTHLHFEMWPGHITTGFRFDSPWYYGDGTPINPVPIFEANGVDL